MDLDEYLVGVVAASADAACHPETLKAMAVIARTNITGILGGRKSVSADELNQPYMSPSALKSRFGSDFNTVFSKYKEAVIAVPGEIKMCIRDRLNTMRPGLVQLEIGVQSTNQKTLEEIRRVMDFGQLSDVVTKIAAGKNVHQHLDLIAGLPFEDLESFRKSFNDVYALAPQQLQLGFLKVLKGSWMYENQAAYDLVYTKEPPYEVLSTKWLSFDDVLYLKGIEAVVEVFYNSRQFEKMCIRDRGRTESKSRGRP